MTSENLESEVLTWLGPIFKKHNISNLSVEIFGNSKKGDGYLGDIVFANVFGTSEKGDRKEFHLALKCSKRIEALRKDESLQATFINEIFFYNNVLPAFIKFQKDKGVENIFNNTPKCYGTYQDGSIEVIALENLKNEGFQLYPRKQCLTRAHMDLVLKTYAKYHATSIAMEEQEPEQFGKLSTRIREIRESFEKNVDRVVVMFGKCVADAIEALRNDFKEDVIQKLEQFKQSLKNVMEDLKTSTCTRVILHGDCWSNNFMYKYGSDCPTTPLEVRILDWQMMRHQPLVLDLSYFLFCCISEKDIADLDDILRGYHNNLCKHLKALGVSEANKVYSYDNLMDEWKKHSSFGFLMATFLIKIHSTEEENVVDTTAAAEEGRDFWLELANSTADRNVYRYRMRYIVEYVVANSII